MNSIIGQVFLWAGFLSGALATVFSTGNFARMGLDVKSEEGSTDVLVQNIQEDAPAWEAGLRSGDRLVSMDGKDIKSTSAFGKMVGGFDSEDPTKIVYVRDDKEVTAEVVVKNAWQTVNWLWYLCSAGVCLVGVCLIQMSKRNSASSTAEKSESSLKQIKANLANAIVNTTTLTNSISEFKPRQILEYIEENLLEDLRDFADGRDAITAEHGLEVFANVMTQFAAGERAINRAWSASADGYVNEAETCVQHGLAMLESANKLLKEAESS